MPSCWRAWLRLASLLEERADLPGYPLEFVDRAVSGDEVLEYLSSGGPFLLEAPTLTLGCLPGFLRGALPGKGFCRLLLQTLALLLGFERGLGLQPAALGGEPLLFGSPQLRESLLLGSPRLPGSLFQGKLLGALTLEALARGALLGFLPGLGLPLFLRGPGAALGLRDLTAHQVAAVVIERSAAVLLAHLAGRIHRRRGGSIPRCATAAGREHEEKDDRYILFHGSPFRFGGAQRQTCFEPKDTRSAPSPLCVTILTSAAQS